MQQQQRTLHWPGRPEPLPLTAAAWTLTAERAAGRVACTWFGKVRPRVRSGTRGVGARAYYFWLALSLTDESASRGLAQTTAAILEKCRCNRGSRGWTVSRIEGGNHHAVGAFHGSSQKLRAFLSCKFRRTWKCSK